MTTEQRNAGRRVLSQVEAQAITDKAGTGRTSGAPGGSHATTARGPGLNRRELLAWAMAGSTAVFTLTGLALMTLPDPVTDPLVGPILDAVGARTQDASGNVEYPIVGGFAYPRIKAGSFGGKFIIERKVADYKDDQPPDLNAQGKFYIIKTSSVVPTDSGEEVGQQGIMAVYQVCTHLGCLIPYIQSEKRFICPCHGSTFERNTTWVRGPAPRNLDQFPVAIGGDGTITVDTGKRVSGVTHA